jgi:hypothetical protein
LPVGLTVFVAVYLSRLMLALTPPHASIFATLGLQLLAFVFCFSHPLNPEGDAFGGIDSKNVDMQHVEGQYVYAIGAPSHVFEPVFVFTQEFDSVSHVGMPTTWDFNWTTTLKRGQPQSHCEWH